MMRVILKAYAKVNMALEVRGRRPDGYHGIETLYRGLYLHDGLILSPEGDGIELAAGGRFGRDVPEGGANLAWRAADLLRRAYPDRIAGVSIRLEKRIPTEAGLGGGSADAAAVLLGLNRLYGLGLDLRALEGYAAQLGSDVPFCLDPLAAIGRGRGEEIRALPPEAVGPALWAVLVKPPFGLATKDVYAAWDGQGEGGRKAGRLARLRSGMMKHLAAQVIGDMYNDLETPAFALEKKLTDYVEWIKAESAPDAEYLPALLKIRALLCGSGSTLAVFLSEQPLAVLLAERLNEHRDRAPGVSDGGGEPYIELTRTLRPADLAQRIRMEEDGTGGDEYGDNDPKRRRRESGSGSPGGGEGDEDEIRFAQGAAPPVGRTDDILCCPGP